MPADRKIGYGIITIFALITLFISVVNPVYEAPDEREHHRAIWHIITHKGLVNANLEDINKVSQEDLQAPLFYLISAGATWFIDQSDFVLIFHDNPHAQIGHANSTDNINFSIHTRAEAWPWRGAVLALHMSRFINVVLGALTLFIIWRTAALLWPESTTKQHLALAFTAFNPMFIFISSASNNDVITSCLTTAGFYLCLKGLKEGLSARWAISTGVVAGLAALAKVSGLTVLLIAGVTIGYIILKNREWPDIRTGLIVLGIAFAVAGWWYIRNTILYNDPTALNAHLLALGGSREVTSFSDLNRDWEGLFKSFWGVFGMFTLPMSSWIYYGFGLLTAGGLVFSLPAMWRSNKQKEFAGTGLASSWLLFLLMLIELIAWTSRIGASQGRLLFPAIGAISLLLSAGWGEILEAKARPGAYALAGLMAIHAVLFPFTTILPAYATPEAAALPDDSLAIDFFEPGGDVPSLRLHSFSVDAERITAGQPVTVTLVWEALSPMVRDWSLFIHAIDTEGILIGQKDSFPAGGRLATSELPAGRTWRETYVLTVNESAYAPETAVFSVGFYDTSTCPACERMPVASPSSQETSVELVSLPVATTGGQNAPGLNLLTLRYNNGMEIKGYSLSSRNIMQGGDLSVTLAFDEAASETPLKISLQVINSAYAVAGQFDGDLMTGADGYCRIGCENTYLLSVNEGTEPGIYDLWLVIYTVGEDGSITQLTSLSGARNYPMDHHILTQLVIEAE